MIVVSAFIIITLAISYIYARSRAAPKHLIFRHTKECPISFKPGRLKRCSVRTDCRECDNTVCVEVSASFPYKYNRAGETIAVPDGKWCLPPKVSGIRCNTRTGNRVLTHDPNLKQFIWMCHCKNSKLVRNSGVYGDCDDVVACGDGDLVCPVGAIACEPGEKWKDNPVWDPNSGICSCPIGKKYVAAGGFKLCEYDDCFPGRTLDDGSCECPPPAKNDRNNKWSSTIPSANGKCIPDPCNPAGYSWGDRCVCNDGSIPYRDELSPTGWICKSPCDPKTNPCGARGRCIFDALGRVGCIKCRYPNYQSADGLCNNIVKRGNAECRHNYECETGACDKTLAPLGNIGDGKKYCAAE